MIHKLKKENQLIKLKKEYLFDVWEKLRNFQCISLANEPTQGNSMESEQEIEGKIVQHVRSWKFL